MLLVCCYSFAQTTLTHNIGTTLVETSIYTCSGGGVKWARTFVLEDFGITTDEKFVITRGEAGFSEVGVHDVNISFNIYEIDENFPDSFSEDDLIGSSETIRIYQSGFQLVILEFTTPVEVPGHVERILVEVKQEFSTSSAVTFMAGTAQDNDLSWFNAPCGSSGGEGYISTIELNRPDARFYINVTGDERALSIEDNEFSSISIYPNPVENELTFNFPHALEAIDILDMKGSIIDTAKGINSIDVSQLASGLYFARAFYENQKVIKRFVKK